jgi:acetolactate synthase small subunit
MIIEQIKAQLSRLVPVQIVHDLTDEAPFVEREMALIKVMGKGERRCVWPTSSGPASSIRRPKASSWR